MTTSFSTSVPVEALDYLFSKALQEAPQATEAEIRAKYELLQDGWGARLLAEGDAEQIREKVLANLEFIRQRPGFGEFSVQVPLDQHCAQVNAYMRDARGNTTSFVPVRVWRTGDKVFACGNADFT